MPVPAAGTMVCSENNPSAMTSASQGNTFATQNSWVATATGSGGTGYIGAGMTSADWVDISFEFTVASGASVGLWVTSDGGGAAPGAVPQGFNCVYIPASFGGGTTCGGHGIIGNIQAAPNSNVFNGVATYRSGVTKAFDQSQNVGWSAQSGMTGLHLWNNAANWVSWCPDGAATTGHVTVIFQ
jgi:hypothetical protein